MSEFWQISCFHFPTSTPLLFELLTLKAAAELGLGCSGLFVAASTCICVCNLLRPQGTESPTSHAAVVKSSSETVEWAEKGSCQKRHLHDPAIR